MSLHVIHVIVELDDWHDAGPDDVLARICRHIEDTVEREFDQYSMSGDSDPNVLDVKAIP